MSSEQTQVQQESADDSAAYRTESRTLRLIGEYAGAGSIPLWWVDDPEKPSIDDFALSPGLIDRLKTWQGFFDENYDPEQGWSSERVLAAHYREAQDLLQRLWRELPEIPVRLDYWQVCVDGKELPLD